MAFESLTDKLQNVFKNLRGKRPSDGRGCENSLEGGQDGVVGSGR